MFEIVTPDVIRSLPGEHHPGVCYRKMFARGGNGSICRIFSLVRIVPPPRREASCTRLENFFEAGWLKRRKGNVLGLDCCRKNTCRLALNRITSFHFKCVKWL